MRKIVWTAGAVALASVALAACGSSSSGSSTTAASSSSSTTTAASGPTQSLKLAADPTNIAYTTKSLTASKPGNVAINFTNPNSALAHTVCVQDSSGKLLGCTPQITGSSTTLQLPNLKAGNYTFYCNVPGHEAAGMKGTLTVK